MAEDLIVVIGYNRPKSIQRILSFLSQAPIDAEVDLVLSIDKSDNQAEVIAVAEAAEWPYGKKRIIQQTQRLGLRQHILTCGDLVENYRGLVMFEDDIVPAPYFYQYVQKAFACYKDSPEIAGISLYSPTTNEMVEKPFLPMSSAYDAFFIQSAASWGQAWTREMWFGFRDWYAQNDGALIQAKDMPAKIYSWPDSSWKKYFMKYLVKTDKYFVYPYIALSTNYSDVGQHVQELSTLYQVPLDMADRDFRLPRFSEGIKYDAFFESESILDRDDICIDLYGSKLDFSGYNYLLSSRDYDFEILATYGLSYKPHELNIHFGLAGEDVHVYDLKRPAKNPKRRDLAKIASYYSNINWKDAALVAKRGLESYVRRKKIKLKKRG